MAKKLFMLLLTITFLASCQNQAPAKPPGPTLGTAGQAFFEEINAAGGKATTGIGLTQPFFSVPGIVISISGEDLQVFEYTDAASAAKDIEGISGDASTINGEDMAWIASPHFYQHGSLIVLYIGSDPATLNLLQTVIGDQVAGFDT
jgi:hypothetical protein